MVRTTLLACGVLLATSAVAQAQPTDDFTELPHLIAPGESVTVETVRDERLRGRLLEVTDDAVVLQARGGGSDGRVHRVSRESIRQVNGRADPLWNGTLLGLGAGFLGGCAVGSASYDPNAFNVGISGSGGACLAVGLFSGGIGAGVGALIDAAVGRHGRPVYRARRRLSAQPGAGRSRTALQVMVRW